MKFKLQIEIDNAAFMNDSDGLPQQGCEVARIMQKLADQICEDAFSTGDGDNVFDCCGNQVGWWKVTR